MATRQHIMKLLDAQLAAGVRVSAAQFAREHGVSARTVYRHRARIQAEGVWQERSRRPHHSPTTTPEDLDAWIVKLRADLGVDNGADFIRDALISIHARTSPTWQVPSRSTINRVLSRHDLLVRNPAKRPRSSYRRFSYARPRDCYQIDATETKLATGATAVIFDVLDDCTRTLVACHAAPAETSKAAVAAITKAVDAYGAPAVVLSDNGAAFTSRLTRPGSLSGFVRTLLNWRIRPINSSPYHPQTCGKVERHHQSLKKWLRAQPAPATITDLQQLLDRYRTHYNHQRRHSALPGRATPQQAWTSAASLGGPDSPPIQTDATLHRCTVAANGNIRIGRHTTSVGIARAGGTVTAVRNGDHATVYSTDGQPIGYVHIDPAKRYAALTRTE
ncbi:IS481 family transposase [Natronosporangium hydrolyticum]|uniref:IS481 family transposase n=1 Tax=Natronosporangium hydrolyticum TaxID=2811111 RepID=A0A895YGC9_9ACTN|nr:DDE-type integrase/transposase/recombinase [Natronosporangium hydrolyticum]QSB16088.1 IS481 family transposase [Natronosporangium hydrolyticum]QSB16430.1 IS481 family transposase [Natronosporangium hydrolyticum]QSB16621.1 IS481 family transposase [Natronosporangium hydrolyticum]